MISKRRKKQLLWIAVNGGVAWLAYLAVYRGVEGATNLFIFLTWLSFVCSQGCYDREGRAMAFSRGAGPSVPRWLAVTSDLTLIAVLVWFGWWWTALAWLGAMIPQQLLYDDAQAVAKKSGQ